MTPAASTIIYPVTDLAAAKAVFGALLGAEPVVDQPYYVQFDAAGQEIGLDPHGHARGRTSVVPFWHVPDVAATLAALVAAGAQVVEDAQDVGGGRVVATVKDGDGNLVGVLQTA